LSLKTSHHDTNEFSARPYK